MGPLLSHSCTQDLRSEETTFRPLNNLLVHGLRRVVHHDSALLVIDLCIYTRLPYQIHNPFFSLVLGKAKACRQVPGDVVR